MSTNAAAWKSNIHLKNVRVAKAPHISVLICQIYSAKSLLEEVSAYSLTFLKSQFNMAFYQQHPHDLKSFTVIGPYGESSSSS